MRFSFIQIVLAAVAASATAVIDIETAPSVNLTGAHLGQDGVLTIDLSEVIANLPEESVQEKSSSALEKKAEVTSCYNFGSKIDRRHAVSAIDDFCGRVMGIYFRNNYEFLLRYTFGNGVAQSMLLSLQPINNCGGFTVDGNCNRLLRLPIDRCNTGGENGKQGGYMTDPCGLWRADPGTWQTDCNYCNNQEYSQLILSCAGKQPGATAACLTNMSHRASAICKERRQCCDGGLGPQGKNCDLGRIDDY